MKPASLALLVLALVAAITWPLSSAIGAARATAAERSAYQAAACMPDAKAVAPSADDGDDDDDEDALALPPGHPPVLGQLPPGHPPIPADGLPMQKPHGV